MVVCKSAVDSFGLIIKFTPDKQVFDDLVLYVGGEWRFLKNISCLRIVLENFEV